MAVITRPMAAPALRPLWLLLVALLLTALAVGGAVVGTALLRSDATIPTGGDAVFAFSSVSPDDEMGSDVMTIQADGTDVRQLTNADGAIHRAPQFSPDGTRIAVRVFSPMTESIVVTDAGGGGPRTIASYPRPSAGCIEHWDLAWSPDGSALAYAVRDGCLQVDRIDIVGVDGVSPPVPLLDTDLDASNPSWSPDGRRIAFVTGTGSVYVVDAELPAALAGGLVPREIGTELGVLGGNISWSPDGSELAVTDYTSGIEVEGDAIHAIKTDGSGFRTVIEQAHNPDWSRDGKKLSFARTVDPSEYWNGRPCTVRIGTVGADGTGELLLDPLGDGCDFSARLSPDGTLLAALLIASTPEAPELAFHLGFVPIDGVTAPTIVQDSQGGSWQPKTAPLPPPPSFALASTSP